jgi:hypothetical protein
MKHSVDNQESHELAEIFIKFAFFRLAGDDRGAEDYLAGAFRQRE